MTEDPNLARLLGANPFFGRMQPDVLQAIAGLCVTRKLSMNEVLFQKGDPGDALFAIRRGQIRIGTSTDEGRRLTLNLLGAGDVFGEIALLDGQPRTADAVASEPTLLFMIRRRDFLNLLEWNPTVSIQVVELLCERIRYLSNQMEEANLLPLTRRLARRLIMLAEDFGSEITVTQEELAVFVGSTRESVNRQLQEWRRAGLVSIHRSRINLADHAGLGAIAR
ncbi:MAG TPA: Crp/Fnr family transcriptional regulator [Gemmatimonadales bacterium]|nr:Crp/Fnr family transcriptional regulator [Gemmatimonadales bacterium]